MNDQYAQQEELDLWGKDEGIIEEPVDETQNQEQSELSPEEFEYQDDEEDEGWESETQQEEPEEKGDYLTQFLRTRNIDRNKVRFQNEDGTIEEVPFDDLEDEDKLAILSEQEELPITDQEIEDLNYLRTHDINLADLVAQQRELAVQEYLQQNSTPEYRVDDMNDDQIFVYALIERYGEEFTDEEIDAELAKAKENEELFNKKVTFLRNQYKEREETQAKVEEQQAQQAFEAEKRELIDSLVSAAGNVNEIQGVELEDVDKNEILDFLTKEDAQGRTEFSKLLANPEAIFKMAWYMKYGEDTFNTTVDYFKNELAKARRTEDKSKNRTVIRKKAKPKADPYGLDSIFK